MSLRDHINNEHWIKELICVPDVYILNFYFSLRRISSAQLLTNVSSILVSTHHSSMSGKEKKRIVQQSASL